jgi:hypothetical protein
MDVWPDQEDLGALTIETSTRSASRSPGYPWSTRSPRCAPQLLASATYADLPIMTGAIGWARPCGTSFAVMPMLKTRATRLKLGCSVLEDPIGKERERERDHGP